MRVYTQQESGTNAIAMVKRLSHYSSQNKFSDSSNSSKQVYLRIQDQCMTSEVFGSVKCDCKQQLDYALDFLENIPRTWNDLKASSSSNTPYLDDPQLPLGKSSLPTNFVTGLVIYLFQEGRGIGLASKIAAYALQQASDGSPGLDTVDANRALGLPDDVREYHAVFDILQDLQLLDRSVLLLTNNPRKVEHLHKLGIPCARIPCIVTPPSDYAKSYVGVKSERMGHFCDL
jgi:GTP cyclohydrolase II